MGNAAIKGIPENGKVLRGAHFWEEVRQQLLRQEG